MDSNFRVIPVLSKQFLISNVSRSGLSLSLTASK